MKGIMKVIKDKILVKEVVKETKSRFVVANDKKTVFEGEVLAVGESKIAVGSIVLFPSYLAKEFEVEEKRYLVITEDDVLAIKDK